MAMIDDMPGLVIADKNGRVTPPFAGWFNKAFVLLFAVQQSGTTAQRPTTQMWVGRPYFDTTLNKPIWAKTISGITVTWVDATGTGV